MDEIFLTMLEVSLSTTVIILAVKLLSPVINHNYTANWKYLLWLILTVRLLIPINLSFKGTDNINNNINITQTTTETVITPARLEINFPETIVSAPFIGAFENSATPEQPVIYDTASALTLMQLIMLIWIIGAGIFFTWQTASYILFRRRILRLSLPLSASDYHKTVYTLYNCISAKLEINANISILICREVTSPLMLGFFKPLLILPNVEYNELTLTHIIHHELTHYKRRDILYKSLMLLANAIHWFNPIVWLMVKEANHDLEISCDAAVIRDAKIEERRQYSETILSCIHQELQVKTALSTHFYGGKKNMKERFTNILSIKKRRSGTVTFIVTLLCTIVIGGFVACNITKKTLLILCSSYHMKTLGNLSQIHLAH